jgi:hypothetical protein
LRKARRIEEGALSLETETEQNELLDTTVALKILAELRSYKSLVN